MDKELPRRNWLTLLPDKQKTWTTTKVTEFKTRAQRTLENMDNFAAGFWDLVEEYFVNWMETLDEEDTEDLGYAIDLLWWIYAHINDDKSDYFSKIYSAEIDTLDLPSKFEKCILHFIIDPEDNLNYRNMKKYLKRLAETLWDENPEFINLNEYLDFLIEATSYYLRMEDWPLRISTHFYSEKADDDI